MENNSTGPAASKSAALPVIPTPRSTRWREFRIKFLPLMVFGVTIFAILKLWEDMPLATGIRGIGEGPVSILASPQDGFIQDVKVPPRGWVEAGEELLTILPFDPDARLDLVQSQLQLTRLAMEPSLGDRNALDFERLRVESLRLKQELAMARANLERAEKALPRHEALVKDQLISRDIYEMTVRDREFYQAEVDEKTKAVAEIDQRLEELHSFSQPAFDGTNTAGLEAFPQLQAEIDSAQTNWAPIEVRSPIAGEVSYYRSDREFVVSGEPILTVNATRADRIVAYLRQPFPFEPEVGMQMEVYTREKRPKRFLTEVIQVGARMEIITNAVAFLPTGAIVDSGLPLVLAVPEEMHIRPGELVDAAPVPAHDGFFERMLSRFR